MKNKIMKRGIIFGIVVLFVGAVFLPSTTSVDPVDLQTAIDDGLAWLVAQQNVNGSWDAYFGQYEAGTGLALYKLCERAYELGYESPFDPDYIYHDDVIDGFDWAFDHLFIHEISPQDHTTGATGTMDDPDTNGNDIGVCAQPNTYSETYSTGILLAGISASRTPARVVNVPTSPVHGWTYAQVVQDMVDFLAFGQVEYPVPGITVEGGWEYFHMDNGTYGSGWMGDQSNSGYAVLGLAEAEAFGATIPQWVKTELDAWIDHVQDDITGDPNDGGSWYSFPTDFIGVNILKTGNLLTQMALVGDTPSTPRVIDAIDYLERHWNDASGWNSPPGWNGTPAQYQAMFCLMKGLVFIGVDIFGGIDWFEDIATVILAQQNKTVGPNYGSWRESSGRGEPVIITEWALLTLEKIAPPPPFIPVYFDIKPGSCPNPINVDRKGVTPVAICGTEDFDVTTIDPETVEFEGIAPIRWSLEDVATPFEGELCDCHELGGDGIMDLSLKFNTQELVAALGDVNDGDVLTLSVFGTLMEEFGGTPFEGFDCVWIIMKGT